ncbi:unnamed protein product [Caenorhabditis sp. 36 PRJEB53466]|nr:unnamed protein product [Caenorhabditis sp. 36 PRJEB53466]
MVEVEKMSDAELRAELSVRGENVGPVTGTTRSLYEKKLKKLIAAGGKTPVRPAASKPASSSSVKPKLTAPSKPPVVTKPKTPDTSRRSIPRGNTTVNSTFNRSEAEDSDGNEEEEEEEEEEPILSPKSRSKLSSSYVSISRGRAVSSTPTKVSPKTPTPPKSARLPQATSASKTSTTIQTTTRLPTTPRTPLNSSVNVPVPNLITDFTPSFSTFDRPGATPPRNRLSVYQSSRKVLDDLGNTTGEEDYEDDSGVESSRIIYQSSEPQRGLVKSAWNKVLGYGFAASKTPGESYDLRAGSSRFHVRKNARTGRVTVRQSNVFLDSLWLALYAVSITALVLLVAYFITSFGSNEKASISGYWAVLKGAVRDSVQFFYNYAILPIVTVALVVLLGVGLFFGHRKYKETKEVEEAKLYALIERIIELIKESSADGEPYVSQPHVRDVMFPPAKRRSAEMARWESAVKFIDQNESRVATEVHVLASGNECAVWKWIGNQSQKRVW